MHCENIKIYIPEFIKGALESTQSDAIKTHIEECDDCKKIYNELHSFIHFTDSLPGVETPDGMKEEFFELLEMENTIPTKKIDIPGWLKVAAIVVFALGTFTAGYFTGFGRNSNNMMQAELSTLKQEVLLANLTQLSGPQKIQAVYKTKTLKQPQRNIINALVNTMNTDNNVNVRLAAINALSELMDQNESIKTELINSLSIQDNPLLQISLIQVLTEAGVTEAREKIEAISGNENTDKNVKEYANSMIKTII